MKPIDQLSQKEAQHLEGVFFDLDDTLLDHGRLTEAAYGALYRLREAGLRLIALTGRPASWAELVARMWPVEGAIAENGAVAYLVTPEGPRRVDTVPEVSRKQRQEILAQLVSRAQQTFLDLHPADDVRGRLTDFTFDIGEHHRPSEQTISAAQQLAREAGARTTRSSVHLHYTFDRADKATGALSYLRRAGEDPTRARHRFAFIGDSENDAPCFSAFSVTVGVRNLRGHFSIPPRFITKNSSSKGFVEFAAVLSRLRQS